MATIKERVKALMETNPELRERKSRLIAYMWKQEAKQLNITEMDDVLNAIALGKLSSSETIRRSTCKVWEEYPHLRPSDEVQEQNRDLENRLRRGRGEIND